jgi:hypothetical protein
MKPHVIPEVEHIDRRWLLAEKYPILRERPAGLSLLESYSWIQRHVGVCGGMEFIGMSGSSLWLDEHYPHWKDPIAYWP